MEKKFSTALSQEAEVGVKWNVQRGWRDSQTSTPAFARAGFGVFVGGVIVENHVDRLVGRDLALDSVEEADEFDMAVALHAAADHRSVQHAEHGEQGGGAVALVIVCHGLAAPGLDRQSGLGAVERLDLPRLSPGESTTAWAGGSTHGSGRWPARGQAPSPTMSASLASKRESRDRLKVRSRCGCSLCARQMRCTEPTDSPIALAIARPVQWVA